LRGEPDAIRGQAVDAAIALAAEAIAGLT